MSSLDPAILQGLSGAERSQVAEFVQAETARAKIQQSVTEFNNICFKKCVTAVAGGHLSQAEGECLHSCVNRFLDVNIQVVQSLQSLQK